MRTGYINGKVYTMRKEGEILDGFVVENGRFIHCGSREEVEACTAGGDLVDLGGACVLPGMTDAHLHLYAYARDRLKLNLKGCGSKKELLERIRAKVQETPKGEWIVGAGFDHEVFSDGHILPNRWELDSVCPDNPLIITRYCLHISCANSLALQAGGVGPGFAADVEGTVEFAENGEPNGVLRDKAASDVLALVPDRLADLSGKMDALAGAMEDLAAVGVTAVHPVCAVDYDLPEYMEAYQGLHDDGRLTCRVFLGVDSLPGCGIRTGLGDNMLKYGFYKLFMDGNMGGRTAYLSAPYADKPDTCGIPNYEDQEILNEKVKRAYDLGIQVGAHCIGDKGAEMFITACEKCVEGKKTEGKRTFRMIHGSLLRKDLLDRIEKLPMALDVQPMFLATDIHWCEDRFGHERSEYLWCWRKLIDRGILLTASSDSPCETFNPMYGVFAAVTRQGLDFYPEGGWFPENKITVYEALRMYTWNPAYAAFEEKERGSIEAGKLADFVIMDQDPFHTEPQKIKDIGVQATYLGGIEIFHR